MVSLIWSACAFTKAIHKYTIAVIKTIPQQPNLQPVCTEFVVGFYSVLSCLTVDSLLRSDESNIVSLVTFAHLLLVACLFRLIIHVH